MTDLMKTKTIVLRQSLLFLVPMVLFLTQTGNVVSFFLGGACAIIATLLPFLSSFDPRSIQKSVFSYSFFTLLKYLLFSTLLLLCNYYWTVQWEYALLGVISAQICYIISCYFERGTSWH